jgi:hypothetical protein
MLSDRREDSEPGASASAWVTLVLGISAVFAVAFGVMLILGREDNETLESPLMLSVARQLRAGPWELYGPFGAKNPLALIHAPLYYHAAALAAWPVAWAGLDSIWAARLAGRLLSLAGLAGTALAAFYLARLGGGATRAAWWAACLIATAPVIGVMPYSVRPDMLGVAFQTAGVFLVLRRLNSDDPAVGGLAVAFAAFGVAACIKQHFVVTPVISAALLIVAGPRGRVPGWQVARGVLLTSAIVVVIYGAEELATAGRMSQAVFVAAANTARIHPGDWMRVWIVIAAIVGRSKGLIAILAAAGLAEVAARRGLGGRLLVLVGAAPIFIVVTLTVLGAAWTAEPGAILAFASVWACLLVIIPVCAVFERRALLGERLDAALWLFLAGELVVVVLMSRASTGAWINYGIQAVVWGCILTARALARVCQGTRWFVSLWPIVLASVLVPIVTVHDAFQITSERQRVRRAIDLLLESPPYQLSQCFFAGCPGLNRVYGQPELVYDEWLYPVFEFLQLAQPRSTWLRLALTSGPIRFVVTTSESPVIDGLEQPLGALGYYPRGKVQEFVLWERFHRASAR